MTYFLMLIGVVFVLISFRSAWKQALERSTAESGWQYVQQLEKKITDLEERTALLEAEQHSVSVPGKQAVIDTTAVENKLDRLLQTLTDLGEKIPASPVKHEAEDYEKGREGVSFENAMEKVEGNRLFEEIFRAHSAGKSITEIAQEFDRGKGEVELILSLKR